jgi:FkbM family methyltransferase
MYYCRARSIDTEEPVYQKLEGGKDHYFLVAARVAKPCAATGVHEQPIIDWVMDNFVKEGKACVDIGAHMGVYALNMARKASHVYAFECSPQSFNYFCANIALQNLHYSIDRYNVALSNKEGVAQYNIRDKADGGCNGIVRFQVDEQDKTPTIQVPTRTLDSYGLTNIGFLKIDVEGHEKEVIEGAVETLKANGYPPFIFESWVPDSNNDHNIPRTQLRNELFHFIRGLGYAIHPVAGWPEQFLATHV